MKKKTKTLIYILIAAMLMSILAWVGPVKEARAASTTKYLFIGNSMTYYNCMPEMFKQMAAAGGQSITYEACTYSGRSLKEHSYAIAAVIRTKGNPELLTEAEKEYFCGTTSNDFGENATAYSVRIYNRYKELIWDSSKKCPKKYDYIILQTYYKEKQGDVDAQDIKGTIARIVKGMNNSSCTYVANATWNRFRGTVDQFKEKQNIIDSAMSKAVSGARNLSSLQGKYRKILLTYTGRAICNYLFYAGTDIAQKREPGAYAVYTERYKHLPVINDMILGDTLHPTQLGSYLEAAVLYSGIYGNAAATTDAYFAASGKFVNNFSNGGNGPNYAYYYNDGKGLADKILIKEAAFIADQTRYGEMNLASKKDAEAWKKSGNQNYDFANYQLKLTFDSNGASACTFKNKTYYYGQPAEKLDGEITKTGYVMAGWARTPNASRYHYGTNKSVSSSWIKSIYESDVYQGKMTLYAVWTPKKLTITFDGNGADTNTYGVQTFEYGKDGQRFSGEIEREGYLLKGWAIQKDAESVLYSAHRSVSSAWIEKACNKYGAAYTVYAVWEAIEEETTEEVVSEEEASEETTEEVTPEELATEEKSEEETTVGSAEETEAEDVTESTAEEETGSEELTEETAEEETTEETTEGAATEETAAGFEDETI